LAARTTLARLISRIEAAEPGVDAAVAALPDAHPDSWVLGVTGPPGAGKSTLINAMVTVLRGGGQRAGVIMAAKDPHPAVMATRHRPGWPAAVSQRTW